MFQGGIFPIVIIVPLVLARFLTMSVLIAVFAFLFGASLGSFASVVAYRLPMGESIARPRSRCPICKEAIKSWYNIPVLGYILTKGQCHFCSVRISMRYVFLEIFTGLVFVAMYIRLPDHWLWPAYSMLALALLIVSLIDIQTMLIPRKVLYPAFFFGFLWLLAVAIGQDHFSAFIRCIVSGVCLFVVFFVIYFLFPKGIGFGDVRLMWVSSFFLGWLGYKVVLVSIFLGIFLAGIWAIGLLARKKVSTKSRLPMGPFLSLGVLLAVLYGQQIAHFWWR